MSLISEHISLAEYECKHCHQLPASWAGGEIPDVYEQFFMDWEEIRQEWGKPIIINSGFRCPVYNKAVGGEELSVHLWGLALDFSPQNQIELSDLYQVVLALHPEFRIGIYRKQRFLHCDCGYEISPIVVKEWRMGARWSK